MNDEALLAFSDLLQSRAGTTTMSYIETQRVISRPRPEPTDPTATVTFIRFREQSAVTATS